MGRSGMISLNTYQSRQQVRVERAGEKGHPGGLLQVQIPEKLNGNDRHEASLLALRFMAWMSSRNRKYHRKGRQYAFRMLLAKRLVNGRGHEELLTVSKALRVELSMTAAMFMTPL